ncbi:hypothetical protein F5Y16DRAFT_238590 [Xylariaceae sp. FL0255]|nr:hypothetical protein F5Y16DRAFT_238590 [Xylariaceae sp. FL0255]
MIYSLSEVGSTRSGGVPSHFTATLVHDMLESSVLESYIKDDLIPRYRTKPSVLLRIVESQLIPLGFRIDTGKPYYNGRQQTSGSLEKYNFKIAHDGMMTVEGDESSVQRAAITFGQGLRLCWARQSKEEIEEGIARFAALLVDVKFS